MPYSMFTAPQLAQVYACLLGGESGRVRYWLQLQHFTQNGLIRPVVSSGRAGAAGDEFTSPSTANSSLPISSSGMGRSGFLPTT